MDAAARAARVMFYDREGNRLPDVLSWAWAFEHEDRVVVQSSHKGKHGAVWISTCFGGFDMGHGFFGRPLIFESMVFGRRPAAWNDVVAGRRDELATVRYATEEDALRGHAELVQRFG